MLQAAGTLSNCHLFKFQQALNTRSQHQDLMRYERCIVFAFLLIITFCRVLCALHYIVDILKNVLHVSHFDIFFSCGLKRKLSNFCVRCKSMQLLVVTRLCFYLNSLTLVMQHAFDSL